MTCIVGLVHEGHVYLGGDGAASDGYTTVQRKESKVFRLGDFVIGFTTSFRLGQLLRYNLVLTPLPEEEAVKDVVLEYMVKTFVEAVRNCLKTGGFMQIENSRETGGTFLVGVRNRLFYFDPDLHVGESVFGYAACGSGERVALGSLYSTNGLDPQFRLTKALAAATCYTPSVTYPFSFVNNADT